MKPKRINWNNVFFYCLGALVILIWLAAMTLPLWAAPVG